MTKTELRVLQLLTNAGGQLQRRHLSPQMSRYSQEDRDQAIASLVKLELITAEVLPQPKLGGQPGALYKLTDEGEHHVVDLQRAGKLKRGKRGSR